LHSDVALGHAPLAGTCGLSLHLRPPRNSMYDSFLIPIYDHPHFFQLHQR
jgi:hypothetical protein